MSPGVEGATEPDELGHVRAGAAVQHAVQPAPGVGQVSGAGVEQLQLLADHPGLGQLLGRVADGQGELEPSPLPLGQAGEATPQQPRAAVERIVAVPPPSQRLLLPAPADVVDGGLPEPHDVERVEHPHRVGQALRQGGGVTPVGMERGSSDAVTPGRGAAREPLLNCTFRAAGHHVEQLRARPAGPTVMRAVQEYGIPLIDEPTRLVGVVAVGVDGPRSCPRGRAGARSS